MYGKKLKELRKIEGWTQEEVANKINVSKQTYSHYENENRRPSLDMIRQLANVYQVNIDDIFSEDQIKELIMLPIVGRISCGNGSLTYEDIEGYEPTPKEWLHDVEHIYLRARGDSMNGSRIYDGDLVLVRIQPEVENGEIAAVQIGEDILLNRLYRQGNQIVLQSENSAYPPIFTNDSELKVIGRAMRVVGVL